MIGWFVAWFQRFVQLGLELAFSLIRGLFSAPGVAARRALAPITIRVAKPDEVVDVRHRVLREGRPRQTAIFPGDDAPDARHWVAEHDGRIVGVVSVMAAPMPDPPDGAAPALQLRGMAVLPELQGTGVGAALLAAVHRDVSAPMWCNARENVVPFYTRAGWRPVGGVFPIEGVGPHQRLWWPGA